MTKWEIKGSEFGNCNCDYSCPCQFNALPTHNHCRGLAIYDIEEGLKDACLAHCRAPASFLASHWRPGIAGAWRMGLAHGAYCLGCCVALMLLLFVGGVMNLVWITGLSLLVLVEKLMPQGERLRVPLGLLLVAAGAGLIVSG